jgi:molybdenum cofactor cytidylyltransferase
MISGIILASGESKRFGRKDKLLEKIGGKTIIENVCINAIESNLDEIVLVYKNYKIDDLINDKKIKKVYNDKSNLGMSRSLKLGIKESDLETEGYLFLLGDQPYIDPHIINTIIDEFNNNKKSIIVPRFKGKNSNPVLFPKIFKGELLEVFGDKGGRDLIKKYKDNIVIVDFDSNKNKDIDYQKDLKNQKAKLR